MSTTAAIVPIPPTVVAEPIMASSVRGPQAVEHRGKSDNSTEFDRRQAEAEQAQALARHSPPDEPDEDGARHYEREHERARQRRRSGLEASNDALVTDDQTLPDVPHYQFVTEADGTLSVMIGWQKMDLTRGRTPEETMLKARIILAATLSHEKPTAVEQAVAAVARTMEEEAKRAIAARRSTPARRLGGAYQPELPAHSVFDEVV